MEPIKDVARQINSLQKSSLNTSEKTLSIYKGELTGKNILDQTRRLKSAFPNAEPGFFDLVIERVKEKGFTDERLKDAVNHIIDNFRYPQPMVSDVISFDKRVKLHSYSDMMVNVDKGHRFEDYEVRDFDGKKFWIEKSEIIKFGL